MPSIDHVLELSVSPQAVYDALTSPAGLRAWWARDSEVGTREGSTITMRFAKEERTVEMGFRIDELLPSRRVAWTCIENGNPVWVGTTLTFDISPAGGGARLSFSHAGFREAASPPFEMTVAGWNHFMSSLRSYLEGDQGQPW